MSEESPNIVRLKPEEDNLPVGDLETPSKKNDADSDVEVLLIDSEIDVTGEEEVEIHEETMAPVVTSSGELIPSSELTPTKRVGEEEEVNPADLETVFSSFPCQVIPETLSRMTRTPPDGEHLQVHKNQNGRLRIYVIDHFKKFSPYSNLTHKPCTVCSRQMKSGEMHLNFPADLDRRRIWANLLGFKYKDILRSKMGPVSFSIAAGPICTEHFAEECFRNHNFNKAAIEAFGVPVAISPDVKTTPSKKRVPWVCTICDFHSCSVVELQHHLLEHTERMLEKKDSMLDVPEAGFMCPFCRKCTYGYKTISGYRRHLNSPPVQHCHLRRIYEFAKLNCRSTELEPIEKWDNWTRRNVYVAYHGCEPPVNEIVLTPSPTKSAYVQNPEERTRIVHDEERRRKAVRSLAFVGKEGGTSVNDHNVMQRAVYLQVRRNKEHQKKYPGPEDEAEDVEKEREKTPEEEDVDVVDEVPQQKSKTPEAVAIVESPQTPMGSSVPRRLVTTTSATTSPVKKPAPPTASLPSTPLKKKRKMSAEEEERETSSEVSAESLRQQQIRDEQFARMVQKRSQQVKRLIAFKKDTVLKKPRKALNYTLPTRPIGVVEPPKEQESQEQTTSSPAPVEPEVAPPPPVDTSVVPTRKSTRIIKKPSGKSEETPAVTSKPPAAKVVKTENPPQQKKEEERPLKSVLARSFAAGVRPSMAKYRMPVDSSSSTSPAVRSLSSGSISSTAPSAGPPKVGGGLFARVLGQEAAPPKRPTLLARRPLILSPRKKALTPTPSSIGTSSTRPMTHHEPSPIFQPEDQELILANDLEVELVEEVTDETPIEVVATSSEKPLMTLAEALEMKEGSGGVKEQELEEISKEMMRDAAYYRTVEDAMKCNRTATKVRAELRLSRHCIRQIEAARARARLFGEGSEGEQYHIFYSNDGAQIVQKNDPKWREIQQQQQPHQDEQE